MGDRNEQVTPGLVALTAAGVATTSAAWWWQTQLDGGARAALIVVASIASLYVAPIVVGLVFMGITVGVITWATSDRRPHDGLTVAADEPDDDELPASRPVRLTNGASGLAYLAGVVCVLVGLDTYAFALTGVAVALSMIAAWLDEKLFTDRLISTAAASVGGWSGGLLVWGIADDWNWMLVFASTLVAAVAAIGVLMWRRSSPT